MTSASAQAFGDLFSGVTGHRCRAEVDLDARGDPGFAQHAQEWHPVGGVLPDRLVADDDAADAVPEPRGGDDQFPVGAAGLLGLGNPEPGEAPVAGGDRYVDRQRTLVVGHQHA
ncbi:MAG: hypothetical protein WAW17_01315 [Rhodococcus sp. (in: high G+C Gram-positive bacteria)]